MTPQPQPLDGFLLDRYPSAEESEAANKALLYKRRKSFLKDLRNIVKSLGYIQIIMVYLRDVSLFRLLIRLYSQFALADPYGVIEGYNHLLLDETKGSHAKFLLVNAIVINMFCIFNHLIFGAYTEGDITSLVPGQSKDRIYLHGGAVLQFIGERLPYLRLELILYDLAILVVQLVLHGLTCVKGDADLLTISAEECTIDGDGYTGNVNLMSIDLYTHIKTVMSFKLRPAMPLASEVQNTLNVRRPVAEARSATPEMPGAFIGA